MIEVAKGIYLFMTKQYGDVGMDGNAVAILSPDGVLVFDSNGTPAASAAVLADIRKLTDQPVRYVVNSHWHWDHWYGTETYTKAFPGVKIVAHEKTREMMAGPAIEFNRPGIERQLPGLRRDRWKNAWPRPAAGTPRSTRRASSSIRRRTRSWSLPPVTYKDRLDLTLGERAIQVRHHDRAVTPGDTFLYLPAEKIVDHRRSAGESDLVRAEQLSDRLAADARDDRRARRGRPHPGARRAAPRQDPACART